MQRNERHAALRKLEALAEKNSPPPGPKKMDPEVIKTLRLRVTKDLIDHRMQKSRVLAQNPRADFHRVQMQCSMATIEGAMCAVMMCLDHIELLEKELAADVDDTPGTNEPRSDVAEH